MNLSQNVFVNFSVANHIKITYSETYARTLWVPVCKHIAFKTDIFLLVPIKMTKHVNDLNKNGGLFIFPLNL